MNGVPLVLYNSLSRAIETFVPIDPTDVRVYSCGPTVYNYAHIGNLRAYVFTDTLGRVLRWKGWPLTHIINITDVGHLTSDADAGDDKMEAAAKAAGQDIWAIAAQGCRNPARSRYRNTGRRAGGSSASPRSPSPSRSCLRH
ncbi:MAG: hypothetical protein EON55_18960, partial [Alphaproteobacteria bacterium]